MVTQTQSGSIERILGRSIRRHHHLVGPGAEAAGVVEFRVAPFALAAGERPRSRYVIKVDRRLADSKERAMPEEKTTADRLAAYSDAVFAVIVTIMVLELRAPDQPAFSALWPLWPTAVSYAVSYLFIAIIWINHYHLMRFVGSPTLRLIWINFVHLFMVSLLPFATAWIARTRLASSPVAFYAGLFVCIDIAYNVFEREVLARADATQVSEGTRRMARRRSLGVLASFTTAMLVAFVAPRLGFGLIYGALILHLRPDGAPGSGLVRSFMDSTRAIVKDRVRRLRNRSRSGFTN